MEKLGCTWHKTRPGWSFSAIQTKQSFPKAGRRREGTDLAQNLFALGEPTRQDGSQVPDFWVGRTLQNKACFYSAPERLEETGIQLLLLKWGSIPPTPQAVLMLLWQSQKLNFLGLRHRQSKLHSWQSAAAFGVVEKKQFSVNWGSMPTSSLRVGQNGYYLGFCTYRRNVFFSFDVRWRD